VSEELEQKFSAKQAEHDRLQAEAKKDFTPTEDNLWAPHSLSSCWCCCDDCNGEGVPWPEEGETSE
jgi:hypothetical protein